MSTAAFIDVKQMQHAAIAKVLCPAIGQREAPIIEEDLKATALSANNRLALDLSQVTVLGSMGLGMLVTITKKCKEGGGKMAIFGLNPALTELVKLTKLDKFLTLTKDQASALEKIK